MSYVKQSIQQQVIDDFAQICSASKDMTFTQWHEALQYAMPYAIENSGIWRKLILLGVMSMQQLFDKTTNEKK